jgi:hypothetical protein
MKCAGATKLRRKSGGSPSNAFATSGEKAWSTPASPCEGQAVTARSSGSAWVSKRMGLGWLIANHYARAVRFTHD